MDHSTLRLQLVEQAFPAGRGLDVAAEAAARLRTFGLRRRLRPGGRVAVCVGSRGIDRLPQLVAAVCAAVREAGGEPVVVPCMGSHGGGRADGQRAVLAGLGVDERAVGAPICPEPAVTAVATSGFGPPVLTSRALAGADHVIVVNRVKPHTDFHGEVESGLVKMLVVGAGQHEGALSAHRLALRHGFPAVLRDHGERLLAALPVTCGVAVVEDQHHRAALLAVLAPEEFFTRERALLARARALLPRLPFDDLDVLIVDFLGKDVSGSGMDTNVVGRTGPGGIAPGDTRLGPAGAATPPEPRIRRIFVRDLTPASHGNASGIGRADFTTTRLLAKVDQAATALNCVTSMVPEEGRLPIAFASDREAVAACLLTAGVDDPARARVAWIRDTASLERLAVSTALLGEGRAEAAPLRPLGPPFALPYDADGNLRSPFPPRTAAAAGPAGASAVTS